MKEKVLFLILDGFGIGESRKGNAIAAAYTPRLDALFRGNPNSRLKSCGLAVGLPDGVMGNSEVGHLNIGAGRIVYQLNTRIDREIENGSFFRNENIVSALEQGKNSRLHLFGLLSDGNVHSNDQHLWAILKMCKNRGLAEVFFHAFMDGRDSLPHSGLGFIKEFLNKSREIGIGKLATISGRYYAMDRDNRWERIRKAYEAIVYGRGNRFTDPLKAMETSYKNDVTDEFIEPVVLIENDEPVAAIEDNDSIFFFNFRADRARQITRSFIVPDFDKFPIRKFHNLHFLTMSEYDANFTDPVKVAFRPVAMKNILGEVISQNKLQQLRLAETEKYAHVTFFFNGGKETLFPNEERILVPSPKVATYDLQPEMSAYLVKDELLKALNSEKYDLIVTNFANCDMVGHTGIFQAAKQAVEAVDNCLGEIIPAAVGQNYNIVLTADHGNAEKMLDDEGNNFTAHSTNDVPFVIKLDQKSKFVLQNGALSDVAPTILKIMNISQPEEMTGKVLIEYV